MNINYFKNHADQLLTPELSKQLGYNVFKNFSSTYNLFIRSSTINSWLGTGYYDLVNTSESFFVKLSQHAGFSQKEIDKVLIAFSRLKTEKEKFIESYIFVDTGFKRTNQSLLSLIALSSRRYLQLYGNEKLLFKNKAALISELSILVKAHYLNNEGKLYMWGDIQRYKVYHQDCIFIFDPEGNLVKSDCYKNSE